MIANNAVCMSRLRGLGFSTKTVYGHAMSFDLLPFYTYGAGGCCARIANPFAIVDSGISVSIVRGGPPIFTQ